MDTEQALQDWLAQRPRVHNDHVFLSYQHRKLSTTSISTHIDRVRKASGVNLTAHRLRHTFADHLLSSGMPITSIQKLMGHRFVETTQNYAAANDRQVQTDFYNASAKLDGWSLLHETFQTVDSEIDITSGSETVQDGKVEIALLQR